MGCFLCLLKIVEIVIILTTGKKREMKQQVLKALANPPRIFYVPYSLAVLNFLVQFLVYMVLFFVDLIISGTDVHIQPLYLALSVIGVHSILAIYSRRAPQIGQIITARIRLFTKKVPKRLVG